MARSHFAAWNLRNIWDGCLLVAILSCCDKFGAYISWGGVLVNTHFDSILLHSRIISVAMNGFSTRVLEYNPCSARVLFVTEIVLGPIFQVKRFFGVNFLDDPKSEKTKKK